MDTVYVLIEKNLNDNSVTVENVYLDHDTAAKQMEDLMSLHEEERAYKIETRVIVPKPKKVKVYPLEGIDIRYPKSPAELLLILKHTKGILNYVRNEAYDHGYKLRGPKANSRNGFPEMLEEAVTARGLLMNDKWMHGPRQRMFWETA